MNYRDAQRLYLQAGWPGVLPLPARKKFPPPEGFTGRGAPYPDARQLEAWRNGGGDGNLCLRLPEGVLGIDVDAYDGKPGAETLARLEAELGALPPTWSSSARPWPSGIRFFRVPPGRQWRDPGPGLEVIHAGWRYAVASPSVHPNGSLYVWHYKLPFLVSATDLESTVPRPDTLPWLPESWVKHMDRGEAKPYVTSDVDTSWLEQVAPKNPEGWEKCPVMLDSASRHVDTIRQGAGRHDAMLRGVSAVVHLAVNGHRGGLEAVAQLREVFENVTTDRSTWGEFNRALVGALQKEGASLDIQSPPCTCGAPPPEPSTATTTGAALSDGIAGMELDAFLHAVPPDYDWLVPGLLERGDRLILTGPEGGGKSTLLRQFGVQCASGVHPFSDATIDPLRVLLLDLENSSRQVHRALLPLRETAGERYAGGMVIQVHPEGIDLNNGDGAWLEELVRDARPDLLITGPTYKLAGGDPTEEGPAKIAAAWLDKMRVVYGCAVLLEAHPPHSSGSNARRPERPYGASLWMRWPEFGLYLADDGALRHWRGARDVRDWPSLLERSTGWPWKPVSTYRDEIWLRIKPHAAEDLTLRELALVANASHETVRKVIQTHQVEWDMLRRSHDGN